MANEDKYAVGDSLVQALGAYGPGGGNQFPGQVNAVDVGVQWSPRPLVLILDSNEGVRWNLAIANGAQVKTIFLTGASGQSVQGAGSARVIRVPISAPFNGYPRLRQSEIEHNVGHRIETFEQKILGDKARDFVAGSSK